MNEIRTYIDAVKKIKTAILQSRYIAAKAANAEQLKLYFSVGAYVSKNTREGKWGTGAIDAISQQLQQELPGLRGFSSRNIKNMRIFFEEWCQLSNLQGKISYFETENVEIRQLITAESGRLTPDELNAFVHVGFTHHIEILSKCKTFEERLYYIEKTARNFWTVETLKQHIKAEDFLHDGKSVNNFVLTIPDEKQVSRAVRAFKDEMLLDYINIEDADENEDIDERVIEQGIIQNIKKFIQSLGSSFCFVGNQHRLVVENEEYFIDLLFYNRELKSLIAIELKKGKFKPSYLGQLNFYLSALDKYEKQPDENPSIGLLLCHEMNKSVVQLAVQDYTKPIGVATYKTARDVPEKYKSLKPIIEAAPKLIEQDNAGGKYNEFMPTVSAWKN